MSARLPARLVRLAPPAAMLVLVVVIWEVLAVIGDVAEFILPRPTVILVSLGEISGSLPRHIQATAEAAGLGYVLGAVVGAGLALLMSVLPAIRTAVYPLVLATQTTPKIAVAPLFIIWFGIGLLPKVLIVALLVFFPILINTAAGLEAVDRSQLDLMRSVHASRLQVYRHVRFPTAVPFIFAGLRLALTVSIIGAIVSEWVAAERGLGYLLLLYNSQLRTAHLFAVLLVLMAAASLSFAVLAALEHRLSWEARVSRGSTLATTAAEAGV